MYSNLHITLRMKQATLTEIRNEARAWFDLVESGETVRVLRNGRPIAEIVPIAEDMPSWKRRGAQPMAIAGVSLSKLILEDRAGSDVFLSADRRQFDAARAAGLHPHLV